MNYEIVQTENDVLLIEFLNEDGSVREVVAEVWNGGHRVYAPIEYPIRGEIKQDVAKITLMISNGIFGNGDADINVYNP